MQMAVHGALRHSQEPQNTRGDKNISQVVDSANERAMGAMDAEEITFPSEIVKTIPEGVAKMMFQALKIQAEKSGKSWKDVARSSQGIIEKQIIGLKGTVRSKYLDVYNTTRLGNAWRPASFYHRNAMDAVVRVLRDFIGTIPWEIRKHPDFAKSTIWIDQLVPQIKH